MSIRAALVVMNMHVLVPSEPLNFVNKSRTSSTIDFEWLAPLHHNGILQSYEVIYERFAAVHHNGILQSYEVIYERFAPVHHNGILQSHEVIYEWFAAQRC